MMDSSGRPLPAPQIAAQTVRANSTGNSSSADTVTLGGERMVRLPGMSKLSSMVPSINYNAQLQGIQADMDALMDDVPELQYYKAVSRGAVSGIALGYMLAPAVDRVREARGNAESALVRAHMIALTIAQQANITGFDTASIGEYSKGDFEHSFAERDVFPIARSERVGMAGEMVKQVGIPIKAAMRIAGFSEEEVSRIDEAEKEAQEKALALAKAKQEQDAGVALEAGKQQAAQQSETAQAQAKFQAELARQAEEHRAELARQNATHQAELGKQAEDHRAELSTKAQETAAKAQASLAVTAPKTASVTK